MEFPPTLIGEKLSKDLAQFHETDNPRSPDLWVYDETIEILPLYAKTATVNAYLWKTGHADEIVLPEIDVDKKLLKFNGVSSEDEITIFGNHYEIRADRFGQDGDYEYEWYLHP